MNLRELSRLPTTTFEENLLTGVPPIDGYLKRLDAELLGRASLRRLTLEEVRDHLLEGYKSLVEQGMPLDQAAQQAVDNFGSEVDIGSEQRRDIEKAFVKNFLLFGASYAILMGILTLVSSQYGDRTLSLLFLTFPFHFLFSGAGMSVALTLGRIDFGSSEHARQGSEASSKAIHLQAPKKLKWLALGMMIFGLVAISMSVLGLLGLGIWATNGIVGNFLLIYLGIGLVSSMLTTWTQIRYKGNQIAFATLFGNFNYTIREIKGFTRTRWKRLWLPTFARTHQLTFVTDKGEIKTIYLTLNPEMPNSDLFIAQMESAKAIERADRG